MLLTGVYTRGEKFLFRVEINSVRRSFMLLQYDRLFEFGDSVQSTRVSGKLSTIKADDIIVHLLTNNKLEPQYYYGNLNIVEAFLEDARKAGFFEFLDTLTPAFLEDYYKKMESVVGTIEVYIVKYNDGTPRKIRLVEYSLMDSVISQSNKLQVYTKSGRVRTLEQLKNIYNLSWIIDNKGNLIRDYRCVRTKEALDEVIEGIKQHDIISFDLETTGVEFYYIHKSLPEDQQTKITGIGVSWEAGTARYIPLMSNKFSCLPYQETINTIFSLLTKKQLIGANLLFDFGVAYYYGYLFHCAFDVMYAEFMIDPTGSRGHKKLKEITRFYAGWETLELDEVLGGPVDGRLIPDLDEEVILIYGGADVDTVWTVKEHQEPLLKGKELIWKIDMSMISLIPIEDYYGYKIDMNVWDVLNEINTRDKANVEKTIWTFLEDKAAYKMVHDMYLVKFNRNLSNAEISMVLDTQPELRGVATDLLYKTKKKTRERLKLSSSQDLLYIFTEIIDYPVEPNKAGKVSLDDEYLSKLSYVTTDNPEHLLKEDLMSVATTMDNAVARDVPDKEKVILSKDALEKCKYPFVIMLKEWRKLDKRESAFLAPIKEKSINSWYNQNTSMTAADTARFINPMQTLQGYMKKMVTAFDSNRYFVQFDLAQVEFRVMIGNAVRYWNEYVKGLPDDKEFDVLRKKDISYLVDRLNVEWTDYHREGGSVLVGTTPAKMTKEQRSKVKAPHFAVPYGAEAYTVAKDQLLKARTEEERRKCLENTEIILMAWRTNMFPLYNYLETKRDIALQPVPDEELPPRLKGGKWGRVTNSFGRCRYYDLDFDKMTVSSLLLGKNYEAVSNKDSYIYQKEKETVTRKRVGSIRRSAGNYPIQSDSRELFALIMTRLFKYCVKHGLSGTGSYETDKIIQSLMIHDENHLQVSKDIHPFEVYRIIIENCLLSINTYPTLYMGIAICDTWYESKNDKFEAPVKFVKDMIEQYKKNPDKFNNEDWRDSPKEYVLGYIKKWMTVECDNFIREFTKDNIFDLKNFRETNDNYFMLTKPCLYTKKFTNKEDDISFEELVLLSHNTNKDLIVRTEYRDVPMKDYIFNYVVEESPKEVDTHLFDDVNLDSEADTNTDVDFDFNDDDLFDLFDFDDEERKEQDTEQSYWLYSNAERSYNCDAELEIAEASPIDIKDTPIVKKPCHIIEINDTWILDIRGLSREKFTTISKFLQKYKSSNGLPLILKSNNGDKLTSIHLSKTLDKLGLEMLYSKG